MDIATVGIVGAGAMGRGIAQIAAEGGCDVLLFDARDGIAGEAAEFAARMIARKAEKGQLGQEAADAAAGRLRAVSDLPDMAGADLVVEAIVEDIEAKQALFSKLEAVCREGAILASNTSSLSITSIASACDRPGRVAGYHFFNPVPLMKVVEVVAGQRTDPAVCEALSALAQRMGHRAVRAADTPGFLVNHAGRAFKTESLRALDEGVTDFAAIDRILRDGLGFRMGPFELMDLIGLNVSHAVMEQIHGQFYGEPRLRPVPVTRSRVAAGLLGRKTGEGFYRYEGGKRVDPAVAALEPATLGTVLVADCEDEAARGALIARLEAGGVMLASNPEDADLFVVMPLGSDCTGAALEGGFPPEETVAVDPCQALDGTPLVARLAVVMSNPATGAGLADALAAALGADEGKAVVISELGWFRRPAGAGGHRQPRGRHRDARHRPTGRYRRGGAARSRLPEGAAGDRRHAGSPPRSAAAGMAPRNDRRSPVPREPVAQAARAVGPAARGGGLRRGSRCASPIRCAGDRSRLPLSSTSSSSCSSSSCLRRRSCGRT